VFSLYLPHGKPKENPGCLTSILNLLGFGPKQPAFDFTVYQAAESLASKGELAFYAVLQAAIEDKALICPKVRMLDVISAHQTENWQSYNNRLMQKHIDFVLCEPRTLRPLVAIELDDRTHQRKDRQERDEFINQVYQAAKLPVLHIKAEAHYEPVTLRQQLAAHVAGLLPSAPEAVAPTAPMPLPEQAPLCPKHGIPMEVHVARQGERIGKRFYGCPKYPQCHEIINID